MKDWLVPKKKNLFGDKFERWESNHKEKFSEKKIARTKGR